MKRALTAIVGFAFHRPVTMLLALVALAGVAAWVAGHLGFRGDFIELLPEDSYEVKNLRFVEQRAGGSGYLVVQLTGGDAAQRRAWAASLAARLEQERTFVRYVEYRFEIDFFKQRSLLLLPLPELKRLRDEVQARVKYEKLRENPLYVDVTGTVPPDFQAIEKEFTAHAPKSEYLESKDGQELYLYVKPTGSAGDLDFDRALIAAAQKAALERPRELRVAFTGPFVIRVEEDEVMRRDLANSGVVAALLSILIIAIATRRAAGIVVVVTPVAFGLALTFAFAFIAVGHLNPVTGFLGAILLGLGVEYGLHLSLRYWEERRTLEPLPAMRDAVTATFPGALTSAATNAAAFAVLLFAHFGAFRQFGAIAAVGVMSTLLGAYLVGPPVLMIAEKLRPFRAPKKPAEPKLRFTFSTDKLIPPIVLLVAFGAWSLTQAPKIGFQTDLRKLKGESPATDLDDHIQRQQGLIMSPAIFHLPTLEDAEKLTELAREVKANAGPASSFDEIASLNDLVPRQVEEHLAVIQDLRHLADGLPESVRQGEFSALLDPKPYTAEEVPLVLRRRFTSEQNGTFVLIFPRYRGYDTDELARWSFELDRVLNQARSAGLDAHLLDGNWVAAKIFALVRQDGPLILGGAGLVVFLMIAASLRSLSRTVLVAFPLFVGLASVAGAMKLFGLQLNFLNVVVLPSLLTIAVDNSVNLFHRYLEEGEGSLAHVLEHTGFAAFVSTLTNASGYGALIVAHHAGLRSIATLALAGVACTFVGTTVLFPLLLLLIERLHLRKPPARR